MFIALLKAWNNDDREEALFALAELRTDLAFQHVLKGLKVDMDYAMQLLQNQEDDNITQHDKELRDRILAAILNLIDFSVCEEYQLYEEVMETHTEGEIDFNSDEYDELLALCKKYNDIYAMIEDADIEYAGVMAAFWIGLSPQDYLVYWTQNDAKVRPWHMELQGYSAPRDEFPSWMIPPIEYNCRCFLEILNYPTASQETIKQIKGSATKIEKPKQISGVYSESLAKCGRIFGPAHDYFNVKESDKEMLQGFVDRLREKYYYGRS